jgi:hypothetical protein
MGTSSLIYRNQLREDRRFADMDTDAYFHGSGVVHQTHRVLARRMENLGVIAATVGALALYRQGYERFTSDVDILVTREGLATLHDQLIGLGYLQVFPGSKALRDTETGVQIDFLVTGDYPGDGKPGPISFPNPEGLIEMIDGLPILKLPRLVELKLASGITGGLNRLKDIADIVEAVKRIPLDESLAPQLHPFVRDKYLEICAGVDRNEDR